VTDGKQHTRLTGYETAVREGAIGADLKKVRNSKPMWSRFGTALGIPLGGIDMWMRTLLRGWSPFGTWQHDKNDAASLKPASDFEPISYPKPDGVLTFDKLTNLSFSGTNHEEDQPVHLRLTDPSIPIARNLPEYAEPAQRYCPANVYEVVRDESGNARFQINAQNCVHCKTCDIKDPAQNITWVCPEGGGGPNYAGM
jgi:electron-transferring-flavoprotein dehydrogenase